MVSLSLQVEDGEARECTPITNAISFYTQFDYSPSPRGEKTRRNINIESGENPFEDPFDLGNTLDVDRDHELSRALSASSSATTQTVRQACIQDQIDAMKARIQWLISQQQSDWALELTDERPPSYRQSDGPRFAVTPFDS